MVISTSSEVYYLAAKSGQLHSPFSTVNIVLHLLVPPEVNDQTFSDFEK